MRRRPDKTGIKGLRANKTKTAADKVPNNVPVGLSDGTSILGRREVQNVTLSGRCVSTVTKQADFPTKTFVSSDK